MQYSRTNQGGSVLAFIIVGVVLASMVVGGVYLMRQRGEQARAPQTDTTKQQDPPANKPAEDKKPETTTTTTQPKPEEKPSSQNTPQPQGNTGQIPATGQSTPPATEQQSGTRPNVAVGAPVDHSGTLPQTGPFDTALQLLAAGILAAVVVAYIQSRLRTAPSL